MNQQSSKSETDQKSQVIVSYAEPPILLNVDQVAHMLGVGTSYVWDRIIPKLPVIREGRRVLVHRADVIAYARNAREAARAGRVDDHSDSKGA